MLEFLEDGYENDEPEARKARLKYLGREMSATGDWLVDHWEKQVARGETPDLDLDEPENAKRRWALMREAADLHYKMTGSQLYLDPIQDRFELDKLEAEQSKTFADYEQLGNLAAMASAGDKDAMEMMRDLESQYGMLSPQGARSALEERAPKSLDFVPPDSVPWDGLPDEIDFMQDLMSGGGASQMASLFQIAGKAAAGELDEGAHEAFIEAANMGMFEKVGK